LKGRKTREILSSRKIMLVDRKQTISVLEIACVARRPIIKLIRIEQAAIAKNFGGKKQVAKRRNKVKAGKNTTAGTSDFRIVAP
jgi:hypothetical protein